MENRFLMGIDLGTSSLKTVLFDLYGRPIASMSAAYPLLHPQNGYAEQEPKAWLEAAVTTVRAVISECEKREGFSASQILGIGISGQMHGSVFLDGEGRVLRPAILWCDERTFRECDEIHERVGKERLAEITGNYAMPSFTASKILWLRKNEPEIYTKCRKVLLPKDYLRYRMTGVYAAEVSDASGTNLLDIKNGKWSAEILSALEIPEMLLPEICESAEVAGKVTAEFAALTGLSEGTPVVGGAADNAGAAVGLSCVHDRDVLLSVGTSGVILAHSKDPIVLADRGIHLFRSAVKDEYLILASTMSAAESLKWFTGAFCGEEEERAKREEISTAKYLEKIAASVPAGSRGLLFLPHLMGGRSPFLDQNAKGVFFGLSKLHGKPEMLRAVMEGVVFSLRAYFEELCSKGFLPDTILACGGGIKNQLWRQIFADNFGKTLLTVDHAEGPALGAAILSGVGVGVFATVEEGSAAMANAARTRTEPQRNEMYERAYRVYRSLYPSLFESFLMLRGE